MLLFFFVFFVVFSNWKIFFLMLKFFSPFFTELVAESIRTIWRLHPTSLLWDILECLVHESILYQPSGQCALLLGQVQPSLQESPQLKEKSWNVLVWPQHSENCSQARSNQGSLWEAPLRPGVSGTQGVREEEERGIASLTVSLN